MADNLKFSIIVPVYNTEKYLKDCAESLLNQTYANIEIIFVDDASTDGSLKILESFKADSRVKVVQHEENMSPLVSRIDGMKAATGDYVLFVDSDDYLGVDACELLSKELSNSPADILEYGIVEEPGGNVSYPSGNYDNVVLRLLSGSFVHSVCNKCFSRKVTEAVLQETSEFYCGLSEDTYCSVLFFSMAQTCRSMNQALYHYRTTVGRTAVKRISEENFRKMIVSLENKDKYLSAFVKKNNPSLLNGVDRLRNNDLNYLYNICISQDMLIKEKLSLLSEIDNTFGTGFEGEYNDELERRYKKLGKFYEAGTFGKVKIINNYIGKGLKKRLTGSEHEEA